MHGVDSLGWEKEKQVIAVDEVVPNSMKLKRISARTGDECGVNVPTGETTIEIRLTSHMNIPEIKIGILGNLNDVGELDE